MNKIPLQNIYNYFSEIYYTTREDKKLKIHHDKSFQPFFYEPDPNGKFTGYNGTKLTKIHCQNPYEMKKLRTSSSYSADIDYCKLYLINKIGNIDKSQTRWIAFDLETPIEDRKYLDPLKTQKAPYPITNIVCYDNYDKQYKEFDLNNYKSESEMLDAFCNYIQERQPDLLLAWNIRKFDYPYLFYRIDDFAKKISPIGQEQWIHHADVKYPALITILDLMELDHKFSAGKRASYKLDTVLQEEFEEEEAWGDTDFINDPQRRKEKCLNDVKRMIKLMNKNKYIETFDSIRLFSKCVWADLPSEKIGYVWRSNNTKPWDTMYLQIALQQNCILPSKPKYNDGELSELEHNPKYKKDGAYRETFKRGIFLDE